MGESAIGVIRVSGPVALAVVTPVLKSSVPLDEFPSHTLRRGTVVVPATGERVDQALCVVMRTPRSATGEDIVELSCHGSPALLRMVTRWLIAGGARLGEPGEFTRRAFLNGRLDLAQAEAVALLISARTERAVALAARALAGGLSERARALREDLLDLVAGLEVTLDFPEEHAGLDVEKARQGRVVHDGITVALVGPPNAGKSSLLNALLGHERAIVAPTPGTTRDVVEGTIALEGVPVRLLDTAGLDRPRDPVEAAGIRRSRRAIEESDLLLVVLDGSIELDARCSPRRRNARGSSCVRRATSPLTACLGEAVAVSALTRDGLDALARRLADEVGHRAASLGDEGGIVASLRQMEVLDALARALASAEAALAEAPLEAAFVDLRDALASASDILGIEVGDAVLDRIFSTFCLGR